jgi:sulfide:quinone oxidoreductase
MKQDYLQMRVLPLADEVYSGGQLFAEDLKLLARQGVRSIVNNRFDGEVPGQPASADLERVAEEFGIRFVHFPVEPKAITAENVAAFRDLCEGLKRPLLVFSRTGARSTRIWEMAEALSEQ